MLNALGNNQIYSKKYYNALDTFNQILLINPYDLVPLTNTAMAYFYLNLKNSIKYLSYEINKATDEKDIIEIQKCILEVSSKILKFNTSGIDNKVLLYCSAYVIDKDFSELIRKKLYHQ